MQMVFSKVHQACHSIVNGIKPGSNSKKTDKHATDCSKAICREDFFSMNPPCPNRLHTELTFINP